MTSELDHDPGIPGTKLPEQLPPQDEPEVVSPPDTSPPESDDEGHQAPPRERESGQD
jgi:hypothetical protein